MKAFTSRNIVRAAAAALAVAMPAAAQAQLFFTTPQFERGPVEPGDPLIGEPIPGATPAEQRAALIWNLRSGLNVAALRCQFSPLLRSVPNYNAVIDHHSVELAQAYKALGDYFKRVHGPREGQSRFDAWSTLTYNNYQTAQSELGFCQTAGDIARDALARRKGQFFDVARERMRELRGSLRPVADRIYSVYALRPLPDSIFAAPDCTGLTGRPLQQCQAQ